MKHLFHLAYIKSPFMFMDVSTDLTCLQGIQASFKRGLVLLRVAASTESQISSTFLNSNSESVAFSFARYINGFGFSSLSNGESSPNLRSIRYFHASRETLARRKDDPDRPLSHRERKKQAVKTKAKFSKRDKKTDKPPAEAPYVPPPRLEKPEKRMAEKTVEVFDGMTLLEFSKRTGESLAVLQSILVDVGETVSSEFDAISIDVAELLAMEIGNKVKREHTTEGTQILPRPPVVTVMGHVDHGKTSLLDALRNTSVAAKEAGGITQHVGAFVVGMPESGTSITFLDTPGHAAFSEMRARGAAVTDIVVLVVAADDGMMPQTLEAIAHARSANVPIVVAINKCDKPGANPERVKKQLAAEGIEIEDIGGNVQVVEVSAVKSTGLDKLEEALLLQAVDMDLMARVDGPAQAYVVEARLDKGRGPLATVIVKAGTLESGQHVVIGCQWGKLRAIRDMVGKPTERATPAMPVEIEGLKGVPMAGDDVIVVESEKRAKMLSEGRTRKYERDRLLKAEEDRIAELEKREAESEEGFGRVELPIIVKSDVQGTAQAVSDALRTLNSPQVFVNIVQSGVGAIFQSDLARAQTCNACIVAFNVKCCKISSAYARVKVFHHRVIYHLLQDIGNLIVEKAPGVSELEVAGEAEVLSIFKVLGKRREEDGVSIAGCKVMDGRVFRSGLMRLLRSGEVLFEGSCASLKREKQDVEQVGKGNECGLVMGDWNDFRVGDVIQCMERVIRKPKFVSSESGAVRIEC
ncbi:translation initiation factor IF-2-like isoform X1 [Brassica rapa]|uniref:translation initiation factor IF-2-like isoform X1 n=1 Tax=Brassica campestris TaxID=3711 RepID=UPI00142E7092|nr:translation initiation factor IF-2-like isoform X1 [Brassica rapa]XP_033142034.1 translation initiation factor IF-2-like isoform X1 [Brassica rapa]